MPVLLAAAIIGLIYLTFRYPVMLRKSLDAESTTSVADKLGYGVMAFFILMCLLSTIYSLAFILALFLAASFAASLQIPRWVFVGGSLLMGILIFYPPYKRAYQFKEEVMSYQQQYPFESLAERLSYETDEAVENWQLVSTAAEEIDDHPCGEGPVSPAEEYDQLPLLADITAPLVAPPAPNGLILLKISYGDSFDQMQYHSRDDRREALAIVHGGWERRFSQLMGNGVFRMRWMYDWEDHLEEGEPENLYLPDEYTPADQFEVDVLAAREWMPWGEEPLTTRPDSEAHLRAVINFANPPGWGFVRSRDEVAGFRPHQFRSRPVVLDSATQELDEWRITRLELVSLMTHETPQAYVERSLPNLETFNHADVPTRRLDDFENRALRFIQEGQDVVIDEQYDHIRMLGSLRAVEQCQQCHAVPRNTLLGAFTYELRKPAVSLSKR